MRLAFASLQGSYMLHRKLTVFSGQIQIFVRHPLSQWIQTESQMIREIDMNTKTMWITRLGVGVAAAGLLLSGANAVQAAPGGGLQQLVTSGVISEDERAAYRAAVDSLKDEGMSCREAKPAALDQLVASGELTAAQAEEISAAKRSGRGNRDGRDEGTTQNTNPSNTGSAIYSI